MKPRKKSLIERLLGLFPNQRSHRRVHPPVQYRDHHRAQYAPQLPHVRRRVLSRWPLNSGRDHLLGASQPRRRSRPILPHAMSTYEDRLNQIADDLAAKGDLAWRHAQRAEALREHARADRLAGRSMSLREAAKVLRMHATGIVDQVAERKVLVPDLAGGPSNGHSHAKTFYDQGVQATLTVVAEMLSPQNVRRLQGINASELEAIREPEG